MTPLHFEWLELLVLLPIAGAIWVSRLRDQETARAHSLIVCGATLCVALATSIDYLTVSPGRASDYLDVADLMFGTPLLAIDALSAPLLPLYALIYLLTVLATMGTKVRRLPFTWLLVSEAILLATFSALHPWLIVALLAAGVIPPWADLVAHRCRTRLFGVHMVLFVALLFAGQALLEFADTGSTLTYWGIGLLIGAVLVRSGFVPFHTWMPDLFEHASFGGSLLFVTPMVGAYVAARLVLPVAPDTALHAIAVLSLVTAVYAAGMALVQKDARRFFSYLFLSHSSLVFAGLESLTPVGLTGAFCLWLSVGLSMSGFGLTLRSVEARTGRLSLDEFHGLYRHTPRLAAFFLLTGLASIGFPGTAGFVGAELLVDAGVHSYPAAGIVVVIVSALNGLAVLHAYFRVFTGKHHTGSIDLSIRLPEQIAVMVLTLLLLGGGLYPQPAVTSCYRVATELILRRAARSAPSERPAEYASAEADEVEAADSVTPAQR